MKWSDYLTLTVLACMFTASTGLECFRCVYDMRKPQGAKVWNSVRRINETNDKACFKPDRNIPPQHLIQSMQRCSPNGHCNKQMWQYRYSNDLYIARGCDDVCYNEKWPNVDHRSQGYDRQDVQYACCDGDRCNGARALVVTSSASLSYALMVLAASVTRRVMGWF